MTAKKNEGVKIGTIFTIVSFFCTFTLVVPMISVMPAILWEYVISQLFPEFLYATNCILSLFTFSALFLVAIVSTRKSIRNLAKNVQKVSTQKITTTMLIFYVLVHPIGYYLLLWSLGFPIDALNSMVSVGSFPFSSLAFVSIGFLIDWYSKKVQKEYVVTQ